MFLRRFIVVLLAPFTLVVTGNPTWEQELKMQKGNEIASTKRELPVTDHSSSGDSYASAAADFGQPNHQYQNQNQHQYQNQNQHHYQNQNQHQYQNPNPHQYQNQDQHQYQNANPHQPSIAVHGAGGGDFGAGAGNDHFGPPSAYHYTIYPHHSGGDTHSNSYYHSTPAEESGGGWLCRTFGGICDDGNNRQGAGALGILGLVALVLKKLKLVKLAPFLPLLIPILPILLPIGLIIIIPIFIAAWFLPVVPVVVVGRALSVSAVRNVQETLLSENCLERISCEAFRVSRGLGFEAHWVHQLLDKVSPESKWIEKLARASRSTTACSSYTCRPVVALQKSLKVND